MKDFSSLKYEIGEKTKIKDTQTYLQSNLLIEKINPLMN